MLKNFLFLLVGLVLGGGVIWFFHHPQNDSVKPIRSGGYKLINPLLECDQADFTDELKPFKSKVESLTTGYLTSNKISHVSVYFRDLNNGPWFGINERETFSPASMLKVPVMMSIFKLAESDPQILKQNIFATFSADANAKEAIKPSVTLINGKNYTLLEIIEKMIANSDNNAVPLIYQNFDSQHLLKTYRDLGIYGSNDFDPNQYMSVKTYASFFRILYNSSYLDPELSEKALEILSSSDFTDGLRGGIPDTIPIAHKFGERELPAFQSFQLHDCGIIYYPGHPYLLCIMTRGDSLSSLSSVIKNISSLVYSQVENQYKKTQ